MALHNLKVELETRETYVEHFKGKNRGQTVNGTNSSYHLLKVTSILPLG